MLPQMDERIQAAAETFEQMMLDVHRDERGVHINTLLSTACAVLAEAMLRATVPHEQLYGDRGIMYAEEAEYVFWGAEDGNVMDYLAFTANEIGMTPQTMPDVDEIYKHTAAAIGKSEIPALSVPEDQRPHFWSMAGAAFVRAQMLEIYKRFDLKPMEEVLVCTLLVCRLLNATQNVLQPQLAFRLTLETIVGCLRLHPVEMKDLEKMAKQ